MQYPFDLGVNYIKEKNEYSVFCTTDYQEIYFKKIDENFNEICNENVILSSAGVYSFYSARLLYDKSKNYYSVLISHNREQIDCFDFINIQNCTNVFDVKSSLSSIFSTIPTSLILPTSILKQSTTTPTSLISPSTSILKEVTTIPTSVISSIPMLKEVSTASTLLKSSALFNKISTLIINSLGMSPKNIRAAIQILGLHRYDISLRDGAICREFGEVPREIRRQLLEGNCWR
jgi:hypothetical protein